MAAMKHLLCRSVVVRDLCDGEGDLREHLPRAEPQNQPHEVGKHH